MTSNNTYRQLFFTIVIILANALTTFGQKQTVSAKQADSVTVLETTNKFLTAFMNLDWEKFTDYFSEDATAFFPPSAQYPYRTNNKSEIMNIFKTVFENAHKKRKIPPYLDIDPKDIKIQVLGQVAIVSFTINDPDMLSRRTLVWEKRNNKWTIIHLHASGITTLIK